MGCRMSNRPGYTQRTIQKFEYALKLIKQNPDLSIKSQLERARLNSKTFNDLKKRKVSESRKQTNNNGENECL